MNLDLREIAIKYLKENGYDGLYNESGYCGCVIDDLMPCDEPGVNCHAGYKVPCPGDDCELGGECDWHVAESKD